MIAPRPSRSCDERLPVAPRQLAAVAGRRLYDVRMTQSANATFASDSLAAHTTLRVGGRADTLVVAETDEQVVAAVAAADAAGEPLLVLGGGSNVVISDDGWPGTVLLIRTQGIAKTDSCGAGTVGVAAGEDWDSVVFWAVGHELAGVECLAGIPGSAGATPIQNVGAYGQEVADSLQRVRVYDRVAQEQRVLSSRECEFGYRDSWFKRHPDRYVVLEVEFRWEASPTSKPIQYSELAMQLGVGIGDRAPLSEVREAVLALRRRKGMVLDDADPDTWSVGSFFTNPIVDRDAVDRLPEAAPKFPLGDGRYKTSAAWLIQESGYEPGYRLGAAGLSGKHTLAITNRGESSAADVIALAREVRDGVVGQFDIELIPEPVLVGCSL